MTPARLTLSAAAATAAAYLIARAADRAALPAAALGDQAEEPQAPVTDGSTALDYLNPWGAIERTAETFQTERNMQDANTKAFLTMIAWAEGTERAPDPYRVVFGYRHTIQDLSDHPAITGEWRGERLSDAMCRGAGLGPGCISTAAGRYQMIRPTWLRAKRALGLDDFGPASQDLAAVWLLRQRKAIPLIEQGRVAEAVALARAEWASLPGNQAGQPQRRMTDLLTAYEVAGGTLA